MKSQIFISKGENQGYILEYGLKKFVVMSELELMEMIRSIINGEKNEPWM